MFGEKPIFGQSELTVDSNGRIFIPATTKREPGEELVLIDNKDLGVYEIYSVLKLKEKFEAINKLITESKTKKEKLFYERMLCEISKSILRSEKIDSQGRFSTGKTFEECDKVMSTGAYDHLIIDKIKK
ncbi:MAG: hypothetical protein IJE04_00015 [Bacilli bacterium]|nr:hypothetical protein [Bacilli bacterium]